MSVPLWTFHDVVPAERQANLLSWSSFDNVIGGIILAPWVRVVAFRWAAASNAHLAGCFRAEFLLSVGAHTYDGFFNSPVGYRAQYAISPSNGIARNRELLEAMTNQLLASCGPSCDLREQAELSLSASQAKVWIDEAEVRAHYFATIPEIKYERWNAHPEGDPGSRAPEGERLVVFGGWLDQSRNEVLNPHKHGRAQEIYERGFS
jgi:hypothetical protein